MKPTTTDTKSTPRANDDVLPSYRIDHPTKRLVKIHSAEDEVPIAAAVRAFLSRWAKRDPLAQQIVDEVKAGKQKK